ncbi:hypothetical protein KSP40_PGU013325 [Platanthera guangdongensis]|uniref:Uncharacterized protein n=1 Tax=Platanthera guangdongensis TaxID=2320717 RepID=A0ABR2LSU3_9ASPA
MTSVNVVTSDVLSELTLFQEKDGIPVSAVGSPRSNDQRKHHLQTKTRLDSSSIVAVFTPTKMFALRPMVAKINDDTCGCVQTEGELFLRELRGLESAACLLLRERCARHDL